MVAEAAVRWASVGVIVPDAHLAEVRSGLTAAGVVVGEGLRAGPGHAVSLLSPPQAKGLEFDAVVVASPTGFLADDGDGGAGGRLLYVALTRAVQELTIVSPTDEPLPAALVA